MRAWRGHPVSRRSQAPPDGRVRQAIGLAAWLLLAALLLCSCGPQDEPVAQSPTTSEPLSITAEAEPATAETEPLATEPFSPQPATPTATAAPGLAAETPPPLPAGGGAPNPDPPTETVKLIFIHHSCGENWLADDDGRLGLALRDANYFVSDTNYGWGPDGIGDRTDIGDWPAWFRGPASGRILDALYHEFGDHSGRYRRGADPDPSRENEIVLFKSCYPNSNLAGSPTDPPAPGDGSTVGGAKQVYNDLLAYFETRPDKLFVAITAPPVTADDSWAPPANARAFNTWLVDDWLAGYPLPNVAVFDFYNVLTSNGGDSDTNDLGQAGGNHHRWWEGEVQHLQTVDQDLAAYPTGDSHPSPAGNRKATAEFVPLLNVFYHRWRGETAGATPSEAPTPVAREPEPAPSTGVPSAGRIWPDDLVYLGAFRLPDGPWQYELGWAWSGGGLAYYPDGDPGGPDDGFPGSLFGTGHRWNEYVSEIAIPVPVRSPGKNVGELNTATTLQPFANIRGDTLPEMEQPRVGLAYLPPQGDQTAGKLYFCRSPHLDEEAVKPSHGWAELDLSAPQPAGPWLIRDYWNYVTSDYLVAIPAEWAAAIPVPTGASGMLLGTGRYRDGGQGARGPSLLAISPWTEGNPPPPRAALPATPLLLYTDVEVDGGAALAGYHHSDEWSGAAWLTAGDRAAVLFVGTKGQGDCWYGNAGGPCLDCENRGWWSTTWVGQFLFYDAAELVAVAQGRLAPDAPQPYATLAVDEFLYHIEEPQQNEHLGAATYDRARRLLYVMEPLVDEDKPLIHVWQVAG